MQPQPHFQPEIMERFAALLERRARNFVRGFTVTGGIVGAAVGTLPLTPAGHIWPIPHVMGFTTLALGAAAGALVGYAASTHRAGMLRLQAQSTLCQLYAQRTSFALWLLLKNRGVEPVVATETVTAPEPTHEPEMSPEPVAAQEPEHMPELEPEPAPPVFAPTPAPVPFAPAFAIATGTPERFVPTAPLGPPPLQSPPMTQGLPSAAPQPMPTEPPVTAPSAMLGSPLVLPEVSRAQSREPWPGEQHLQAPPPPLSPTHFVD